MIICQLYAWRVVHLHRYLRSHWERKPTYFCAHHRWFHSITCHNMCAWRVLYLHRYRQSHWERKLTSFHPRHHRCLPLTFSQLCPICTLFLCLAFASSPFQMNFGQQLESWFGVHDAVLFSGNDSSTNLHREHYPAIFHILSSHPSTPQYRFYRSFEIL